MQFLSWLWSEPLAVGEKAPDFSALDHAGRRVSLRELQGKNVVLLFYPGDDTRLCTQQVCDLRDSWASLRAKNVLVYGVNPAGVESHKKFAEKYQLPFPLLIDPGQKIAALYQANGLIVKRTVYLIGPDGKINFGRRGVPSPAEVLEFAV